jgi:ubiquinol-cytochrome c reductase cytochrome b subunit
MRVLVFIGPPIAFIVTKRICLGLQHADRELVLHGYETGIIMRAPDGEYSERHEALVVEEMWPLVAHERNVPPALEPEVDANGVRNPRTRGQRLRVKMWSVLHGDDVEKPTRAELEEAAAHHHDGHHEEAAPAHEEIETRQH